MFRSFRRQPVDIQVGNADIQTPRKRTLASWFPNLFINNKKGRKNAYEYDVAEANADDLQTNPTLQSKGKKLKPPKKPSGGYVISKPTPVKRNDCAENARTVVVDQLNTSLVNAKDTARAGQDPQETECVVASTYEAPISYFPVVHNPNRRNRRLPAMMGEYRHGHRTTLITIAPGSEPVEWDQDYVAFIEGTTTRPSTTESEDLVRAAYRDPIPHLSVDSFASGLSSAYEPPASPILATAIEQAALLALEASLMMPNNYRASVLTSPLLAQDPDATPRQSAGAFLPSRSPTTAELHTTFDDLVRRADEEYERQISGGFYADSVSDDDECANQAEIAVAAGSASVEGHDLTWDELKEIADREYEEALDYNAPVSEAPSVRPRIVTGVSAAPVDDGGSEVEELSEVEWEEWGHHHDGDEEHQDRRDHAFDGAAPSAANTMRRSRSRGRHTIPRAGRRVVRFFKTGKEFIHFLSGGDVIRPLAILK